MFKVIANRCLFFILVILFTPTITFAMEMSSKRDCAICHVMWLNDFRTEKKTLIKWQSGNVLMKDTQGVVSTENMCYSCHDGYVNDSRSIVWKHNSHKTFVKPSDNVNVPSTLPLSNKGELYCGTCHSAHGAGAAPDSDRSGRTSFFRERNDDLSLCMMCHRNEADYRRTNGHPLGVSTLKLPVMLFELGGRRSTEGNKIICQTCHKAHGAKGEKIVIVDSRNSKLCIICHDKQKFLVGTKHDLRLSLPEASNIKAQRASESGPCGTCHTPHNSPYKRLWARRLGPGNPASEMCMTCHNKTSKYKTKHIGNYSHPINVEPVPKTFIQNKLPLYSTALTKSREGRIQCFTCHEVHQWDPNSAINRGSSHVEGDASNSFLRMSNSSLSRLCIECHKDKKQLIASDHNLSVTAPDEKNLQRSTAETSGPCGACHLIHNAAGKRLWSKRLSEDKDFVTQLCFGCHNKDGAAKEKLIGDNYHPVDVIYKTSNTNGTKKETAILLPLYDDNGDKGADMKIRCLTCHEPHTWDPQKNGPNSDYAYKNIEGDAANSFLRIANFPSSSLCKICHVNEAMVDGTAHDLNLTAPQSKNILGQTVKASGQCGVCHLVHNSPNKLKLWARPYGPIAEKGSIMDALCTSCHSKGNNADNKIPLIATHPEGKLINNILRYNKAKRDYTLIFDKNGKEVNVGNLSCASCHNAHQWSFEEKKINEDNSSGKLSNKFLRTASYNTVCIDCHGPDALLRYQNFHDPEKRAKAGYK